MITITALMVVLAAVAFVGFPLLDVSEEEREARENADLNELLLERDSIFAAMSELDADHSIGTLSDGDHAQLKASYEEKALKVLRALDKLSYDASLGVEALHEDEIERQVEELRRGRVASAASPAKFCRRCGTALEPDDNYCSSCGSAREGM
ncbi:MAG: zinc-ribbon domain-containing protein [Chloroflexi bacterium]|nr:zinc-ribbon domain-containing protein [Chloroflexota bacterium]